MPTEIFEMTINWNRCIHVDTVIDDQLVRSLTPDILALRQLSNDPITIAINSPGGSLTSLDTLLGLVTGPDQDNKRCRAITVAVQNAYSAAANLLAFGQYSVALPHSEILFHDVRYGGIQDVTPTTARIAAAELQNANERFSLRLANYVFRRLTWNYIQLESNFESINKKFRRVNEKYTHLIQKCCRVAPGTSKADVAGFATALFASVSPAAESLIDNAMDHLGQWGIMSALAESAPEFRAKGSRRPGMLDGTKALFGSMRKISHRDNGLDILEKAGPHLKLILTILTEKLVLTEKSSDLNFSEILEKSIDDYKLMESINHKRHFQTATKNLLRYKRTFFTEDGLTRLNSDDPEIKQAALDEALPTARLFWHFCVLLCRELFNGEHSISPRDAQILGLVDEVAGGGPIQSVREWNLEQAASETSEQASTS